MEAARRARRILTGFVLATPVCLAILASIPALAFPRVRSEDAVPADAASMQSLEVRGAVLSDGPGLAGGPVGPASTPVVTTDPADQAPPDPCDHPECQSSDGNIDQLGLGKVD